MDIEVAFRGAREGNAVAIAAMKTVAKVGHKDADKLLLQLTREDQAETGEDDFATSFKRVAEANPDLHLAYLKSR